MREPGDHDRRDIVGEPRDEESGGRGTLGGTVCPPAGIGSLGADDWIRIREELPNDGLRRVLVLWGAVPVPVFRDQTQR